ncbi:MAG: helix-turn-helix transcriptional regulator [Thermoguttaceae bacterium]|jgi:transcriptional regulator with XRE-family HTH domain
MKAQPSELREEIAGRLRMARETAGLSQGQVAKRLDMHRPTISEIEAGRRRVSAEEIKVFAELYGIDANWITEGSKDPIGHSDKILLAARRLSKLKDTDLERLMQLIQMMRASGGEDESQ